MRETDWGQLLKALALLLAGGGLVWWQWRDVARAQKESRLKDRQQVQHPDQPPAAYSNTAPRASEPSPAPPKD